MNLKLSVAEHKGDILEAQAAISLTVGSESIATITSFTLYELAKQTHLQTRMREEILEVLDKNQGKLTYGALRDMKYLHMVVSRITVVSPC
jgi:cytochrome P450 family 6